MFRNTDRKYQQDLQELIARTEAGEHAWETTDSGGFVLPGPCGRLYLQPTITGLMLAVKHTGLEVVVPLLHGDILHVEVWELLIRLYEVLVSGAERCVQAIIPYVPRLDAMVRPAVAG